MLITDDTKASKIAARLIREAGRINRDIRVTVSEHSPESSRRSGCLPQTEGWQIEADMPTLSNGRKDYVSYLMKTQYREVYIRLSTIGGKSKVYVRRKRI